MLLMRSILQLIGLGETPVDTRDTESVRRIAAELARLPADVARYVAAFAYVLARVAHADWDVSDLEISEMRRIVSGLGELDETQADLVVELAKQQTVQLGGTENYVVTRQFRDLSSKAQRLGLLRCMFAVAAADDSVSHDEELQISQIATELGLTSDEVTAVRVSYRDKLASLKET